MSIKDDANDNAIDSNDDISVYDVLTWCSNFDKKFIEDVNHDESHYLLCGRHRRAGSQKVGRQRQALQRQRDCGENWSDWFLENLFMKAPTTFIKERKAESDNGPLRMEAKEMMILKTWQKKSIWWTMTLSKLEEDWYNGSKF